MEIIELIFYIVTVLISPLMIYTTLWWLPLIFLTGLISGEIFKKNGWKLISPYVILDMSFSDNYIISRIIGIIYSIIVFIWAYLLYNEEGSISFLYYYLIFIGATMLLGVILSFFDKEKK